MSLADRFADQIDFEYSLIDRMRVQVDVLYLSVERPLPDFEPFGLDQVPDPGPAFYGLARDTQNPVTAQQPGALGRTVGADAADDGRHLQSPGFDTDRLQRFLLAEIGAQGSQVQDVFRRDTCRVFHGHARRLAVERQGDQFQDRVRPGPGVPLVDRGNCVARFQAGLDRRHPRGKAADDGILIRQQADRLQAFQGALLLGNDQFRNPACSFESEMNRRPGAIDQH